MTAAKLKRRKLANMDFGEALARFAQTKPEEVKPPRGRKRKRAKRSSLALSSGPISPNERNQGE
jgi:hypothetical protein